MGQNVGCEGRVAAQGAKGYSVMFKHEANVIPANAELLDKYTKIKHKLCRVLILL